MQICPLCLGKSAFRDESEESYGMGNVQVILGTLEREPRAFQVIFADNLGLVRLQQGIQLGVFKSTERNLADEKSVSFWHLLTFLFLLVFRTVCKDQERTKYQK